jgi:hypothetical protein
MMLVFWRGAVHLSLWSEAETAGSCRFEIALANHGAYGVCTLMPLFGLLAEYLTDAIFRVFKTGVVSDGRNAWSRAGKYFRHQITYLVIDSLCVLSPATNVALR